MPLAHRLGTILGWLVYAGSPTYRRRMRENLALAGLDRPAIRHAAIAEAGRAMIEIPAVWFRPLPEVLGWIRSVQGLEHLQAARAGGRGVIVLTPHQGCFELLSYWVATYGPLTVLYRPPKTAALAPVMEAGRARDGAIGLAPTTLGGVRKLIRALRAHEMIGLLPDQVPSFGEGVWTAFFGRPAYTMTLPERLQRATGAAVVIARIERRAGSDGYTVCIDPLPATPPDAGLTVRINQAVEQSVRACPTQYLWGYNRYKGPARARSEPLETTP